MATAEAASATPKTLADVSIAHILIPPLRVYSIIVFISGFQGPPAATDEETATSAPSKTFNDFIRRCESMAGRADERIGEWPLERTGLDEAGSAVPRASTVHRVARVMERLGAASRISAQITKVAEPFHCRIRVV